MITITTMLNSQYIYETPFSTFRMFDYYLWIYSAIQLLGISHKERITLEVLLMIMIAKEVPCIVY